MPKFGFFRNYSDFGHCPVIFLLFKLRKMNSQNPPSASLSNEQTQVQAQQAYQEWKGLIEALNITHKQQGLPKEALGAK